MPLGSLFRHVACVGCRCDNQPEISQDYYSVENLETLLRSTIKRVKLCRRVVVAMAFQQMQRYASLLYPVYVYLQHSKSRLEGINIGNSEIMRAPLTRITTCRATPRRGQRRQMAFGH